jgi:hypothetical protein
LQLKRLMPLIDNFAIDSTGRFFVTGFDTPEFVEVEPDGSNGPLMKIGEQRIAISFASRNRGLSA